MKKLEILLSGGARKDTLKHAFHDRPKVDRTNLGPFVRGYVSQALMAFCFQDLDDLSEAALQQMVRDCIDFYWRNRELFEILWRDPQNEYSEKRAGKDFWLARNGEYGFLDHVLWLENSDPASGIWEQLETSAVGFGPFPLIYDETTDEVVPTWGLDL